LILERLLDRLIDALKKPKQRDRTVLVILGGYLFVWTLYGFIAKNNQDLHVDMTELIAWSRDLAFGFPKHPPFAAILVRAWFAWFPIDDWAYYLLAILTAVTALWIAWQLFADYLPPTKRVIALCLLTFIPFFNFHALKFNVNTVLMPLWAVTTFWFLRSYRTHSAAYAALAGVGAALCMVTKYWSIFLLVGLGVAAISDKRRRAYFRSSAPWITISVGVAVISPHIGWLQKHDFSPMEYAISVHGGQPYADAISTSLRYCADALAYISVPIVVVLLIARPKAATLLEMVWPADLDRRLVAVAFWTALWIPTVPAVLWGIGINAIWTMASWTLLPVLLLSSHSVRIARASVRWVVASAILLPCAMLIVAPAVALVAFKRGLPPELTQTRMLADQVQLAWRAMTPEPLRYVGGNANLAYGVVTYVHDRPQALPGLPERAPTRLRSSGFSLVCEETDNSCIAQSSRIAAVNPASRTNKIELVRNYSGIAGQPQRYVIFLVPPSADRKSPPI
jgi:dolichyl-phosphate-mannose-protein mannosyltransferase